jgi:hypothetical protein
MTNISKLISIKIVHTAIWTFFNVIIFYLAYAVIVNKINLIVWIGIAFIAVEGIVLLLFEMNCPLTLVARKYTNSRQANFDIYLPNWLALNTKLLYTTIFVIILCALVYRIITNNY